jgi:putative SOS response-associated peptidase YedK
MSITQPLEAMARLFDATLANDLPVVPNYNVCPTVNIHTVVSAQGTRHLKAMRWGFVPHWYQTMTDGPLLINADQKRLPRNRLFEKPAGRDAV